MVWTYIYQVDLQRDVNAFYDIFKPNVADFVFCLAHGQFMN